MNTPASAVTITRDLTNSPTGIADLQSIADSVEAAIAHVTFTSEEIEGVLALDNARWRSLSCPTSNDLSV
jgi:hypothetical protein